MIQGVEYKRHIPKAMAQNAYKVTFSCISSLQEGETVYKVRDKGDKLLIGHTFHRSMDFDRETLECHSIVDGRLLVKVERIK